jgi:hypothetical protein
MSQLFGGESYRMFLQTHVQNLSISLSRHWATSPQVHTEIPEDGASEALKNVGVN